MKNKHRKGTAYEEKLGKADIGSIIDIYIMFDISGMVWNCRNDSLSSCKTDRQMKQAKQRKS